MLMIRAAIIVLSALVWAIAATAQTPATQPPVRLQPGETPVAGQCLTQQELDLTKGLQALTRPTRGAEYADHDDQLRFDPHYFVGTWRIEGVLPESPFGAAG